jgi:hypothetical protein
VRAFAATAAALLAARSRPASPTRNPRLAKASQEADDFNVTLDVAGAGALYFS